MADTPKPKAESKGTFGFLTRKVGPLPVWAWGGIAFGAYYWYTHFGPGAKKAAAAKQKQQQPPRVIVVDQSSGGTPRRKRHNPNAGQQRLGPQGASGRLAPLGTPPQRGDTTTEEPQFAMAPMTAGAIYGDTPVGTMNGDTDLIHGGVPSGAGGIGDYDNAETRGPYVPAG